MGFMDEASGYPAISFDASKEGGFGKGEVVRGTIVSEPAKRENMPTKFGEFTGWVFTIEVEGEKRSLYVRTPGFMAGAIAEAVQSAGVKEVQVGSTLSLAWTGEKDTGKGNPAKTFSAKYEPAQTSVAASDIFGE